MRLTYPPWTKWPHLADDISKCFFMYEKICISVQISLRFVPKGQIASNCLNQRWTKSLTRDWYRWFYLEERHRPVCELGFISQKMTNKNKTYILQDIYTTRFLTRTKLSATGQNNLHHPKWPRTRVSKNWTIWRFNSRVLFMEITATPNTRKYFSKIAR